MAVKKGHQFRAQISEPAKAVLDIMAKGKAPGAVVSDALLAYSDFTEGRALIAKQQEQIDSLLDLCQALKAERDVQQERADSYEELTVAIGRILARVDHALDVTPTVEAMERVELFENSEGEVTDIEMSQADAMADDPDNDHELQFYIDETAKKIRG